MAQGKEQAPSCGEPEEQDKSLSRKGMPEEGGERHAQRTGQRDPSPTETTREESEASYQGTKSPGKEGLIDYSLGSLSAITLAFALVREEKAVCTSNTSAASCASLLLVIQPYSDEFPLRYSLQWCLLRAPL